MNTTLTASEIAELDRRIAVMQAFREGKRIQRCYVGETDWQDEPNPHWNWPNSHYRIAPEPRKPRECWVIFPLNYPHPRVIGGATKIDAMLSAVEGGDEVVHMREVLPGDVVPITPKRDAVIVQYIDGRRHVSIECVDSEKLPALEREAKRIMHS